jgi:ribose 5-phosphate isomerase B
MHSLEEAAGLAEAFVSTPFSHDPRHQRRIDMLLEYERTGVAPPLPEPVDADKGTAG